MEFEYSKKTKMYMEQLTDFMNKHIVPNEQVFADQLNSGPTRWQIPPIMEELKAKARERGLWNLFLPESERGAGLTNLEYAPLCEIMGRSPIAPEVFNCSAPDTGNMEVLERYGTPEDKKRWLEPLLEGKIRSAFAMTEPKVASSDATNIESSIARDARGGHRPRLGDPLHHPAAVDLSGRPRVLGEHPVDQLDGGIGDRWHRWTSKDERPEDARRGPALF